MLGIYRPETRQTVGMGQRPVYILIPFKYDACDIINFKNLKRTESIKNFLKLSSPQSKDQDIRNEG
jgi:hypothetical protein